MEKLLQFEKKLDDLLCELNEIRKNFDLDCEEKTLRNEIETHLILHLDTLIFETSELHHFLEEIVLSYDDHEIKEKFSSHKLTCSE